jgi:hypothetical protein
VSEHATPKEQLLPCISDSDHARIGTHPSTLQASLGTQRGQLPQNISHRLDVNVSSSVPPQKPWRSWRRSYLLTRPARMSLSATDSSSTPATSGPATPPVCTYPPLTLYISSRSTLLTVPYSSSDTSEYYRCYVPLLEWAPNIATPIFLSPISSVKLQLLRCHTAHQEPPSPSNIAPPSRYTDA